MEADVMKCIGGTVPAAPSDDQEAQDADPPSAVPALVASAMQRVLVTRSTYFKDGEAGSASIMHVFVDAILDGVFFRFTNISEACGYGGEDRRTLKVSRLKPPPEPPAANRGRHLATPRGRGGRSRSPSPRRDTGNYFGYRHGDTIAHGPDADADGPTIRKLLTASGSSLRVLPDDALLTVAKAITAHPLYDAGGFGECRFTQTYIDNWH